MQRIHNSLLREKPEPSEGFSPMPIFMVFIFGAFVFWGGVYIANYSGGFRSDVFDPTARLDLAQDERQVQFDPIARGRRVYATQCAMCHQAQGQGLPGVYPPVADSSWVVGDERLPIKVVLHGLQGPITVRGNEYNGVMQALGSLSDRDIAAVVSYIRQEWGNDASMVDEETVAEVRAEFSGRTSAWTARELREFHPDLP